MLGQLQPILTQVSALLGAPRTAMPAGTGAGTVAGGGPTTDAVAGANSIGTTPSLAASLAELVSVLKELTQAINSAVSSGRLTLGGGPGKGSTTQAGGTVQSGTAPLPGSTVAGAGGAVANGAPANGAQPAAPGAAAAAAPAATTPAAPNAAAPAAAATAAPAAAATTPDVTPIPGSATGLGAGTTTLPPVGNTTLVAAEAAGTGEPTNDPVMPTLADGEGVGEVPPAPAD